LFWVLTTLIAAGLALGFVTAANATPDPEGDGHKVGICHRTASDTNPYVFIEVDEASLDAHLNNLPGHPAKTNEDGSPRNDYLAQSAEECVVVEPTEPPPTEPPPTEPPPTVEPPTDDWTSSWTPSPDVDTPDVTRDLPETGISGWVIAGGLGLTAAGMAALYLSRKRYL
jgi:LPXTG-motif cell wall-anchored protein